MRNTPRSNRPGNSRIAYRVTDAGAAVGGVIVERRAIAPGTIFRFPADWSDGHVREMADALISGGWIETAA